VSTENDTCPRCERRRAHWVKPGCALAQILIAVLLVDVYVT